MSFTIEHLEYILLVFVRIASIVFVAPFFNNTNVPRKVKAGVSFFLTLVVMNIVDYTAVSYDGVIGYSILIVQEAITGVLIGLGAAMCLYILNFSGHMIDMEIGFAMAMQMDPLTKVQSTITSTFLSTMFMFVFIASDMHYYIINVFFDSYQLVPIGEATILGNGLSEIFTQFVVDYFIIGFRIILPIFCITLILNVVLGILAKVAPQMNMFVIGIQLKVFVGLFMIYVLMSFLPGISNFIFEQMQHYTKLILEYMAT